MYTRFFNIMKTKHPSEQVFFLVSPIPARPPSSSYHTSKALGLHLFSCGEKNDAMMLIPSFSMIQACVEAYGKENRIEPSPVIGLSSVDDLLYNAIHGGRDLFTPFPGVPFPGFADGETTDNFFDFLLHDLYHCLTISQIPQACRQEIARIAQLVSTMRLKYASSLEIDSVFRFLFLDSVYTTLVDMDFEIFRPAKRAKSLFKKFSTAEILLLEIVRATQEGTRFVMEQLVLCPPESLELSTSILEKRNLIKSFYKIPEFNMKNLMRFSIIFA